MALTKEQDEPAARALAAELDHLPLALEQAGRFIAEAPGIDLAGYKEALRNRSKEMFDRGLTLTRGKVATAWTLTLQRLRGEAPAAVELLSLAAFAAEDFPLPLLRANPLILPERLAVAVGELLAWTEVLTTLQRHSLAKIAGDGLWVHRVLQTVIRDDLEHKEQQWWAGLAVRLLDASFPQDSGDVRTWPECERLVPQALAATGHSERLEVCPEETAWLLERAATYLQGRGQLVEAKGLFERALAIGEATAGPDHPDVASFRNNLGRLLRALGDLRGARTQIEQAVASGIKALGPGHQTVATFIGNLGGVFRDLGDLKTARAHFERARDIHAAVLGPDHPDVGRDHNNLGIILRDLGDRRGARAAFQQALTISEAAFPGDHPRTAMIRSNLGAVLHDLGELEDSRDLFEQALEAYVRVVGRSHPDVAAVRVNLGRVLEHLGDPVGAEDQLSQAQEILRDAARGHHPSGPIILGGPDTPRDEDRS
jgi:tetratricopeptide (TPR) repeat protein